MLAGGENMATRNKHIRTPYEDERKKHRAAASRHVLVLEAQIKEDDKRKLFHIANDLRIYGNHLTNITQKRFKREPSLLFLNKERNKSAESVLGIRFFTVVRGIFTHNSIQSSARVTSM